MTGFVYVIASSNGLYKIGHTNEPRRRLSMLRTSTADTLTLLGVVPGTLEQERELHHLFRQCRVAREWFHPCRAMEPLLSALRPVVGLREERAAEPMPANEPWRQRVAKALADDPRSLREISVSAGLGVNFASEMLKTGKAPTTRSLIKLANALGISPALIFERAA